MMVNIHGRKKAINFSDHIPVSVIFTIIFFVSGHGTATNVEQLSREYDDMSEYFNITWDYFHTMLEERMDIDDFCPIMSIMSIHIILITGSAVALHCCKAHAKINRKWEI